MTGRPMTYNKRHTAATHPAAAAAATRAISTDYRQLNHLQLHPHKQIEETLYSLSLMLRQNCQEFLDILKLVWLASPFILLSLP